MILAAALAVQVALAPCKLEGVPGEARCGSHKVWEDREAKKGRQIALSIIVLDALEPDKKPDPFFMLAGGPGDAPSFNACFFSRAFHDIRRSRDIVLVDLRGTGTSAPLVCPELAKPGSDGIFDSNLLSVPAVKACRMRLETNADLRFYTTEIAVDDLEVAAPEDHAPAGEAAWRSVVARCAKDAACAKLVHQLVNGDDRGVVETAVAGRGVLGGERLSAGFFLSVSCTEDVPYTSKDADTRAAGTFGGNYRLEQQRAACKEWTRGTESSAHRQPTTSAIPTLLLSGELDPVTPPSGAEAVRRHLSNGRHAVIRNNGHPIGNAEKCIGLMIGQLLDRASTDNIDQRCAADNPAPPFLLSGKNQ